MTALSGHFDVPLGMPPSPWSVPLFPTEAAKGARSVDDIYLALIVFSTFFTLVICVLILYFAVRYRASARVDRAHPIQHTLRYELTWIIIPTVLALGLYVWAAKAYLYLSEPPPDARTVYVVGKQWMWKIQHPEGRREINTLHVPAGAPIRLVMTSQDVIHSFFVPAFRVKQDVLPGRYTTMWFQATRPGKYHLYCSEYCGPGHSQMQGYVIVVKPADYQRWLTSGPKGEAPAPGTPGTPGATMAVRGKGPFFRLGCNSCHLPESTVIAPQLAGLYGSTVRLDNGQSVVADEEYIRESILDPQAQIVAGYPTPSPMPTYQGQVSEEELRELIEFVKSLKNGWPKEYTK